MTEPAPAPRKNYVLYAVIAMAVIAVGFAVYYLTHHREHSQKGHSPATQSKMRDDEMIPSQPARRQRGHDANWMARHDEYCKVAVAGNIDLLFLGDSITDDFRKIPGAWDFFQQRYGPYRPANFGIDGDKVQHLLWRIMNGECKNLHPRVATLLIGTNNLETDSPAAIAKGIATCVQTVRRIMPETKVLLLALFPRDGREKAPAIQTINETIAKLDDGKNVRFLNLYNTFLQPDGTLSKEIMYDGLHPSLKGYHIWADAMQPLLDEMYGPKPASAPATTQSSIQAIEKPKQPSSTTRGAP